MCKRARPSEGLGYAVLGGGVLQMISVSWTDEDIGFFERGCDIRPNLYVAHECCVHMFSTTLLVEQGWSQLISLCPPAIALSG